MAFFDEKALDRGKKTVLDRLEGYRGFRASDNRGLHQAIDDFYAQLRQEGRWINEGHTPNQNWENRRVVDKLKDEANKAYGLGVRATWILENQDRNRYKGSRDWRKALDKAEYQQTGHVGGWSKTTGQPAEARAEAQDGTTLEYGVVPSAFDATPSGFPRGAASPTLNYGWEVFSDTFMGKAHGQVDADIFHAVDPTSVLARIEMKKLEEGIKAGRISGVTIHVRERNEETMVLDEIATFNIRSQASFDALQTVDQRYPTPESRAGFQAAQNREYGTQQVVRSIIRNRQGMQHSLDDFKQYMQPNEDRLFFVTAEGQELPRMVADNYQMKTLQKFQPIEKLDNRLWALSQQQGHTSSMSSGYSAPTASGYNAGTGSTSSFAPLVPVNTPGSGQGLYMTNTQQYLPTAGQSTYYPDMGPAPQFNTVDYGNPLTHSLSNMSIAPNDTRFSPSSGYNPPIVSGYNPPEVMHNPPPVGTTNYSSYNTAPANPTAGYDNSGGYGHQGSTSSSDGIGEPLERVNRAPSPPPVQQRRRR